MPAHKNGVKFQPKGGMCFSCKHIKRDCSGLPFDEMPVIAYEDSQVLRIVRCLEFERAERGK